MRTRTRLLDTMPDTTLVAPALRTALPPWVERLLSGSSPERVGEPPLQRRHAGPFVHLEGTIPNVAALTPDALERAVASVYAAIGRALRGSGRHPLRFWSFVPDIGAPMPGGLDRYMVFNAGRYQAYTEWYGTPGVFHESLATASAVGVTSPHLVVHCLAAPEPGQPVENPRQTSAWAYSSRYGPRPPCFARATIATIDGSSRLLIGGTSSISGEDSRHEGHLTNQLQETLHNLAELIGRAVGTELDDASALGRMIETRVYVRRAEDGAAVASALRVHCPGVDTVEVYEADLCRRNLLVEIEGVATL